MALGTPDNGQDQISTVDRPSEHKVMGWVGEKVGLGRRKIGKGENPPVRGWRCGLGLRAALAGIRETADPRTSGDTEEFHRVSQSPGWPLHSYVSRDNLEL